MVMLAALSSCRQPPVPLVSSQNKREKEKKKKKRPFLLETDITCTAKTHFPGIKASVFLLLSLRSVHFLQADGQWEHSMLTIAALGIAAKDKGDNSKQQRWHIGKVLVCSPLLLLPSPAEMERCPHTN